LNVFKVTLTCLGSTQAFRDPALAPKEWCILKIGADIIPVGKLNAVRKIAPKLPKLTKAAKALAKELKATKISAFDKRLLKGLDGLGSALGVLKDPASMVDVLATDGTVLNGIRKTLTAGKGPYSKAFARLKETEAIFGDIFTTLTGIQDVLDCQTAFH